MSRTILHLVLIIRLPWFSHWCKAEGFLLSSSSSAVQRTKDLTSFDPEFRFSSVLAHTFKVCLVLWPQNQDSRKTAWGGFSCKFVEFPWMFGQCSDFWNSVSKPKLHKCSISLFNNIGTKLLPLFVKVSNIFAFQSVFGMKSHFEVQGFPQGNLFLFQLALQRMILLEPWNELPLVTDADIKEKLVEINSSFHGPLTLEENLLCPLQPLPKT